MSADGVVVDPRLVRSLQARVAEMLTIEHQRRERRGDPRLTGEDEHQLALALIDQVVADELEQSVRNGADLPADRGYDQRLAASVHAAMFGAGELQELLDDQAVENININGCDEVWVTYAGDPAPVRHRPIAATDDDLIAIIQSQAAHAGINPRPWTPATPELDLRLQDGSRLSAVMGAGERPTISIRRNRYPQMFLPTLVELGTVTDHAARFLQAAVRSRCNLMVAGATDAGKTTLLRALVNVIDPMERLITVERALELGLRRHPDLHPNVVEWEMVLPDAEGRGGISMAALVQRSLRADPSRVIVGEVLGPEIVTMLNAMSQGNDGSLSTIHARSSLAVLDRIASYAAQSDGLEFSVTHSLIAGALDFVVFIAKSPLAGGVRCVTEIREIAGFDGDRVVTSEVFIPSAMDGRAARSEYALTAEHRARLESAGYTDTSWYVEAAI
ncbi:MAG TPA: ATPase, T2SS/T4P/T4SS family [Mycobacteriales bacterium]|nr:ATPase, T2SS/T4P/T4SS family [Mycobacteriales bacterium]